MKFLAILEDSFREAIASYVCMVQIALTVVFVLLVASLSFYPMDARSAFQPLGPYFLETTHTDPNAAAQLARIALHPRDPFAVLDAASINGAETPQNSYRLTFAVQCADAAAAERLRQQPEAMEKLIRCHFGAMHERRYVE